MIHDLDNAKYLTDAQWLRLMEIVRDNSPMQLHMPKGENCPVDLMFKETNYVINSDGSYSYGAVVHD